MHGQARKRRITRLLYVGPPLVSWSAAPHAG